MQSNWKHDITPRRILSLATLAFAVSCGSDGPTYPDVPDGPPVNSATISATPAERFTPGGVRLQAGGTITFAFGSLAHNVFFDNAPAGAPANITAPTANQSVTLTFDTPGTFRFNCHIHPGMTGTVEVVGS